MPRDKNVEKTAKRKTWKIVLGASLCAIGMIFGYFYLKNPDAIGMAYIALPPLGAGIFLVYTGFKTGDSGFQFKTSGKKYTGKENCIIVDAVKNPETNKDVPLRIEFIELKEEAIPVGARLKYVRNYKKHFYELIRDTKTNALKPVFLPDKKYIPPAAATIPFTMQSYQDYMEYNPPSTLQKIAPWIMLAAMFIIGLFMVMTNK